MAHKVVAEPAGTYVLYDQELGETHPKLGDLPLLRCFPRHDFAVSYYGRRAETLEHWAVLGDRIVELVDEAKRADAADPRPDATKPIPKVYEGNANQRIVVDLPYMVFEAADRMMSAHGMHWDEFVQEAIEAKIREEAAARQ